MTLSIRGNKGCKKVGYTDIDIINKWGSNCMKNTLFDKI